MSEAIYPNPNQIPLTPDDWQGLVEADLNPDHEVKILIYDDIDDMKQRAYDPSYYSAATEMAYKGSGTPEDQAKLREVLDPITPFIEVPDAPSAEKIHDAEFENMLKRFEKHVQAHGELYWENNSTRWVQDLRQALQADPHRVGKLLQWRNTTRRWAKEAADNAASIDPKAEYSNEHLKRLHTASHEDYQDARLRPERNRRPIEFMKKVGGALGRATYPPSPLTHSTRHKRAVDEFMNRQRDEEDFARGFVRGDANLDTAARNERIETKKHAAKNEKTITGVDAILGRVPELDDLQRAINIEQSKDRGSIIAGYCAQAIENMAFDNYDGSPADHGVYIALQDADIRIRQLKYILDQLPVDGQIYGEYFDRYVDVASLYVRIRSQKEQLRIDRANRTGHFGGRSQVAYRQDRGIQLPDGRVLYSDDSYAFAASYGVRASQRRNVDGSLWRRPTIAEQDINNQRATGLAEYTDYIDLLGKRYETQSTTNGEHLRRSASNVSDKYLEIAENNPADIGSRLIGNQAAYWAAFLRADSDRSQTESGVQVRPDGSVVVEDSFYGQKGIWNIARDGRMNYFNPADGSTKRYDGTGRPY